MENPWALEQTYQRIWATWFPDEGPLTPEQMVRLVNENISPQRFEAFAAQKSVEVKARRSAAPTDTLPGLPK